MDFLLQQGPFLISLIIGLSLFVGLSALLSVFWGAPWVPTGILTIYRMLKLAEVSPDEFVLDLGAGDGRIVLMAAWIFGAKAQGVEIDPIRCFVANGLIALAGRRKRARVLHGDLFEADISDADVIIIYLLQATNQKLKPKLEREVKQGARIVSRSFSISGWAPVAIDKRRRIFLYEMGKTGQEVWTKIY
jgi:SAM-dependent methyltransferase